MVTPLALAAKTSGKNATISNTASFFIAILSLPPGSWSKILLLISSLGRQNLAFYQEI
jgi:hypothetical protein